MDETIVIHLVLNFLTALFSNILIIFAPLLRPLVRIQQWISLTMA